jgi:hypothetical protein
MLSLEYRNIPQQISLRSSAQAMTMRQAGEASEFQNNSKSGKGTRLQGGVFGFRRKPPLCLDFSCFERARWASHGQKVFVLLPSKGHKITVEFLILLKSINIKERRIS